jgi:hypothetical protein
VLQLLKVPIKPTAKVPGAAASEIGIAGGVQDAIAQRCIWQTCVAPQSESIAHCAAWQTEASQILPVPQSASAVQPALAPAAPAAGLDVPLPPAPPCG